MIIEREMQRELLVAAKQYPVVTIMGPRQSGKTTLAKSAFPEYSYFSLESPDIRTRALDDPRAFLSQGEGGMILDEIQKAPELLSYIQEIVDKDNVPGNFILTGSHNLLLIKSVSQSLAGRTALLNLLPFSIKELNRLVQKNLTTDEYLLSGFFPGIHERNINPYKGYNNYFETYIQKDLRDLMQVKDIMLFQKFVRLCSGRIGQIFNANELSNEVGVSSHTIKSWLSILKESYIMFTLEPYHANTGKRLIKSPKLYFYDVGLASYLLGIETAGQIMRDPLRGNLFENMVVLELMKHRFNRGRDSNLFFYRDKNMNEVDILYRCGHKFIPIEIKSAQTYNGSLLKGLKYIRKNMADRIEDSVLVYDGEFEGEVNQISIVNYRNLIKKGFECLEL